MKTTHQGYFPPWNLWAHKEKNLGRRSGCFLLCLISFEFGPAVEIRAPGVLLIESLAGIKFPVVQRRRRCQGAWKSPARGGGWRGVGRSRAEGDSFWGLQLCRELLGLNSVASGE